jgi:hypothetical protein
MGTKLLIVDELPSIDGDFKAFCKLCCCSWKARYADFVSHCETRNVTATAPFSGLHQS